MKVTFRCPPELRAVLPEPYPARRGVPDWFKKMPMEAYSDELEREVRTFKHCTPFLDAMTYGFIIPFPTDITVDGFDFSWNWDIPQPEDDPEYSELGLYNQSPISFHSPAQAAGSPYFREGVAFVKFHCFWTIALEPGCSLYVTHPANRYDLPYRILNGIVDCDRYTDAFVEFPTMWVDPDFRGVLKKGTPLVQCIAFERHAHELAFDTLDTEDAARFVALNADLAHQTNVYKNRFRAKKG